MSWHTTLMQIIKACSPMTGVKSVTLEVDEHSFNRFAFELKLLAMSHQPMSSDQILYQAYGTKFLVMKERKVQPSIVTDEQLLAEGICPCGSESSVGCSVTGCPLYLKEES